jgi:hypothetical protein
MPGKGAMDSDGQDNEIKASFSGLHLIPRLILCIETEGQATKQRTEAFGILR